MANIPALFRQADVTRAIKAVRAAGLPIHRTEVTRAGSILIWHQAEASSLPVSELDREQVEWEARNGQN